MYFQRTVVLLLALAMLGGCSRQETKPEPAPPVVEKPKPAPKKVKKARQLPPVVILVSEDIPAYRQVAEEVKKQLPRRSSVVHLSNATDAGEGLSALLKKPQYQQFVAIGLAAAQEAKRLAGREDELIFCQVFNYQDYKLIGPRAKGVGALPGTAEMFSTWSRMSPTLKSVGVITGPGLEEVIQQASLEAEKNGIQLQHKVVGSDKEMLFEYKQMSPAIQGLWMLPDNRVLSGQSIKELMSFSVLNGKQVVVFSDAMLRLGGLMSVTARSEEVANKVLERLDDAFRSKGIPGSDLILLQHGDIRVNGVVARRYNLNYQEK